VKIHPRVTRVLRYLRAQPGVLGDVSLPTLAGIAGLSESRLRHVFTESLGVALRPYILWLRVQRPCGELIGGASVTKAAHEAGFSDSAHLARTFRRMLGVTPTQIAGNKRVARGVSVQDELTRTTKSSSHPESIATRTLVATTSGSQRDGRRFYVSRARAVVAGPRCPQPLPNPAASTAARNTIWSGITHEELRNTGRCIGSATRHDSATYSCARW
jgi:AraC-like DNA-binding protein